MDQCSDSEKPPPLTAACSQRILIVMPTVHKTHTVHTQRTFLRVNPRREEKAGSARGRGSCEGEEISQPHSMSTALVTRPGLQPEDEFRSRCDDLLIQIHELDVPGLHESALVDGVSAISRCFAATAQSWKYSPCLPLSPRRPHRLVCYNLLGCWRYQSWSCHPQQPQ